MTTDDRTNKRHPLVALEKITGYLDRGYSPAFLGFIASEIGYSLAQTEAMLLLLVEAGQVRRLTADDLRRRQVDERCVMYELVR